jgi:DNA-binding transcriptional ArsR family regulator
MAHTATQTSLPREELYALHASFCQGLSDPKRLLIVAALRDGEKSVGDLGQLRGLTDRYESAVTLVRYSRVPSHPQRASH